MNYTYERAEYFICVFITFFSYLKKSLYISLDVTHTFQFCMLLYVDNSVRNIAWIVIYAKHILNIYHTLAGLADVWYLDAKLYFRSDENKENTTIQFWTVPNLFNALAFVNF